MKYYIFVICCFCLCSILGAVQQSCSPRKPHVGNRKCKKSCRTKADCVSPKKDCVCDGTCGFSCINTNTDCEHIRIPEHGSVTITPYNKFGAVARYRCNDGYSLKGVHFRVCQGDRTWSDAEPICIIDTNLPEKVECKKPPIVHNAHHNGAEDQEYFDLGVMLLYACDEGFSSSENKVDRAWCVGGGVWVGPNMTCNHAGCPLPNTILNGGYFAPGTNNKGAKLTYYCNDGYHLSNLEYRTCLPDGTWDGHEPSCEKVLCGIPPEVEHARHDGNGESERYPSGRQLTYKCEPGYFREGNARAMCNGDGVWVGLSLTCSARNCGFPGEIDNGWRSGYMFEYPHQVSYQCKEGYDMEGDSIRRCEANGKWSGRLPRCIEFNEAVECVHLTAPIHGRLFGSGNAFGTLIRIECDIGFKLVGPEERRCQSDRQWSGRETRCRQIDCGMPEPFYNGYVLGLNTSVGAVIFFSCNARTNFEGKSFEATCQENGEWSSPPPTCWAPCPSPPKHIDNGLRIYEGLKHGNRARYQCWNGYQLNGMDEGADFLVCELGKWRGGNPTCDRLFEFSHYITKIKHGIRIHFECDYGYARLGPSGATCVNGKWRPDLNKPGTKCVKKLHPHFPLQWIPCFNTVLSQRQYLDILQKNGNG
ncbi:hypothetical protein KUTeg_021784 [Tegillarca granosa]|uniref:Sushi domain-containing protein n=1 Tax=Tegillarca granosa TaxID=220873 RepID=A0ABQ9E9W2_TEGGR|nr:hypothetical protein KUTeg_021784 [Tegillarca granosa]